MEGLDVHIGLTPEEMMTIFNRMYLEVWNYSKEKINWEEEDITRLLLEVFEVVITAVRDGVMLTMFENNEKIYYLNPYAYHSCFCMGQVYRLSD